MSTSPPTFSTPPGPATSTSLAANVLLVLHHKVVASWQLQRNWRTQPRQILSGMHQPTIHAERASRLDVVSALDYAGPLSMGLRFGCTWWAQKRLALDGEQTAVQGLGLDKVEDT